MDAVVMETSCPPAKDGFADAESDQDRDEVPSAISHDGEHEEVQDESVGHEADASRYVDCWRE